jgi:DNA-binding HxlR family transcriptional regulator
MNRNLRIDRLLQCDPVSCANDLKRLRTHGLIKKVAYTYKYYLTKLGRCALVTALVIREYFVQPTLVRNAL